MPEELNPNTAEARILASRAHSFHVLLQMLGINGTTVETVPAVSAPAAFVKFPLINPQLTTPSTLKASGPTPQTH